MDNCKNIIGADIGYVTQQELEECISKMVVSNPEVKITIDMGIRKMNFLDKLK